MRVAGDSVMLVRMTPESYLALVEARLRDEQVQIGTDVIGGLTALVAYRPQFKLAWAATKLHLFTVVMPTPVVTVDALTAFTGDALQYAVNHKGGMRGFQSGVAAIAVMVGQQVEPAAADYAQRQIVKRFSAFAWPAAVDLSRRRTYRHEGRVVVGGLYAGWMRRNCDLATPEPGPDQ